MDKRRIFTVIIIAVVIGFLGGLGGSFVMLNATKNKQIEATETNAGQNLPVSFTSSSPYSGSLPDFTVAAEMGRRAVVHVRTEYYNTSNDPLYNFFFGIPNNMPIMEGTGSGVIISKDGYIVTNNHVIENATDITITLFDKRQFKAKVIGKDPTTDIALLKIDADSLPVLAFGNSDNIKVGEWVLAIGNPFNLTSTVTAGIVSAKARNISILDRRYAIESFIQTDAAVNPGNSGGALINTKGELIGINTAIASRTGSFIGYSFAVPVNIVKKVVADLIEYGTVQRAYLGVNVVDINKDIAKRYNLDSYQGVLLVSVLPDGAAEKAGLKEGDVITAVDGKPVNEVPELLEHIGMHRPGDKVTITYKRDGKEKNITVVLTNEVGNTNVVIKKRADLFGATFEDLTDVEKSKLGINYGVKVVDVAPGKFLSAGVRPGYIILKINDKPVNNVEEVKQVLSKASSGVFLEGIYPNGTYAYYAFGVK